MVFVGVGVSVGVAVGVLVGVGVAVLVRVGVGVAVGVAVLVGVGVAVLVGAGVCVAVVVGWEVADGSVLTISGWTAGPGSGAGDGCEQATAKTGARRMKKIARRWFSLNKAASPYFSPHASGAGSSNPNPIRRSGVCQKPRRFPYRLTGFRP